MDIKAEDYPYNWDGEGAPAIIKATIDLAAALEALFNRPPHYAPAQDGSIGFEWVDFKNSHKVYVNLHPDRIEIYARIGEKKLT